MLFTSITAFPYERKQTGLKYFIHGEFLHCDSWQGPGPGPSVPASSEHSCTGAVLVLWAGWWWAGCSAGRTFVVSGASLPFLPARSFSWRLAADTHRPECCFGSELRQTFGTKQSALLFVPTDPPCMTKWRKKEGKKKEKQKGSSYMNKKNTQPAPSSIAPAVLWLPVLPVIRHITLKIAWCLLKGK